MMKNWILSLTTVVSLSVVAQTAPRGPLQNAQKALGSFRVSMAEGPEEAQIAGFDETTNYHIGLNLYQDAQLTDLFGASGSQLCAPVAITQGMAYLRYAAKFALKPIADLDRDGNADTFKDSIRYFFEKCGTDRDIGTRYHAAIYCMRAHIEESGFKAWAYIMGAHAPDAPPGSPIESTRHVLTVDDVRATVGRAFLVLMGVGWYKFDAASNTWVRDGGHFFNVYGYNWNKAWAADKMQLHVVNSWINYEGRSRETMFDTVTMTKVAGETGIPWETAYELKGTGFDFTTHRALVEDIFVAVPLQ